ncbi:ectonucleotide pyrophosphatase/phosphodiesterase family member 1 [Clarias gariepinus]|uniref:ectonucleotide pyrophosphatase/phosphodiesterase family member 1 n=1 Tax=Clarias gariepinus TaxID=13013 RepID=UPI00234DCCA7|nr:ectonucleotide pyrophosphatase/phosphodiesterase family member 1 [Clarias gariepinus]
MRMEIAEKEEWTARQGQAATLLGTGRVPEHPDQQQSTTKCRAARRKIITAVILITLLAVILAVIFILKLHNNQEGKQWTCSKFRCGEERLPSSLCSCAADCERKGDCCTNYYTMCKGVKGWLEDECEDIKTPQCPESFSKPPLILISMDGFRAEYLKRYGDQLSTIKKLRTCGISAKYMRSAYPTKTFPNHYTIVTGLYPESHGIVDNKMYDVTHNVFFSLKEKEKFNPFWYHGEPVWITAMNNNLKSGTFFWPGSDVPIKGKYPNKYEIYNGTVPFEMRVMTILKWLSLPQTQRPDFYTLYLHEPDRAGHYYGPMSTEVSKALLQVDQIMQMLMDGLKQRDLHKCVNLVLLSDHGMEEASCTKAAYVSSYQENTDAFTVIQGPAARIRPKRLPEDFFTFGYDELVRNLSCRAPDQPMKPYLKEHLPKRLHFASSVRIERAHLYMKPQWQAALKPSEVKYCSGGFHGSDNVFTNMQTIFIGYGPAMKFNTTVEPFENIEVYNLMCDLLAVAPAPNNGTHGSLNHLLRNPTYHPVHPAEMSSVSICSSVVLSPKDDLGCTCKLHNKSEVEYLNQRLITSVPTARHLHLPYGAPRVLQENAEYCMLQHSSYISAYSKDIRMPLWVAYSLKALSEVQPLSSSQEECVRADVRIPAEASQYCSFYQDNQTLTYGFLHPPNLASYGTESDSLITSNMAPMFTVFKGIWDYFHNVLVVKYSKNMNGINVMSGPVFDKDFDGKYDDMKTKIKNYIPLPTHFFVILMSCRNVHQPPHQCESPIEAVSFILPHRSDTIETCHNSSDYSWVQNWIQFHVARIRDIELLTGLSFYPELLPVEDALQLKTFLKTF